MMKQKIAVEKLTEYTGHKGSLYAMCIDEQQRYMYTSGDDGVVAAWDLTKATDDGNGVIQLQESVYALHHIETLNLLVVGTSIGNVYLVDLLKKTIRFTYRLNQKAIYNLAFHPQTNNICVLHAQGILSLLDASNFSTKKVLKLGDNHLRAVLTVDKESFIWLGTSDNRIVKFSLQDEAIISQWKAHNNSVFALSFHQEGKYLISGGRDAYLKVWDLQNQNQEIKAIPAHNFTINAIDLSPSGDYFVTASRDKTIKLWDAYSFELLKVIDFPRNESHTHSVNRISWLNDETIVSCGDDRKAMRWRVRIS